MTPTETVAASMTASEVDTFAILLLDTLYALSPYAREGLMPVNMNAKPATYEKYPRLLFTLLEIQRADGMSGGDPAAVARHKVESAFTNWRSQVLRKLDYLDISASAYQKLEQLQRWMLDHAQAFDKVTLRHLRKSMFGRTYAYLYPRLSLIMEFGTDGAHAGLLEVEDGRRLRAVADSAYIAEHFAAHTRVAQQRISESLGEAQVDIYLAAAQIFLVQQQAYFDRVFRSKASKQDEENSK